MLVSYMGAQPQNLPKEHEGKSETELNILGFEICPEKPALVPGQKAVWVNKTWNVEEPSASELAIQWQTVKNKRDDLLSESDKIIVSFSEQGLTAPTAVKVYRSLLNRIEEQANPFDITWPEKPTFPYYTFWSEENLPPAEAVKEEAYRRIIAICPEWKQRNLTAQAAQLAKKGEANWTPEEAAAWAAGEALWSQIAAIRAASDVIEAMDPIPANFYELPDWP